MGENRSPAVAAFILFYVVLKIFFSKFLTKCKFSYTVKQEHNIQLPDVVPL